MKGLRVGYIRVSTNDQNTVRQLDNEELDRTFTDTFTGKVNDRPQLNQMIQFVREGDEVIVHSMDRLARNVDGLRMIVFSLTKKGVSVRFVKEKLTFNGQDSSMSNLLLSIMGAFAEFEHAIIKERQREGIALAKKRGVYVREKKLSETQIAELRQMVKDRYRKTDIAKHFGISRSVVYKSIKENNDPPNT